MFSSSKPDLIKPQKHSQQIIEKIRNAILTNNLEEGRRLPREADLMRHFGVSRQTMREALCALETMGLLDIRTGVNGGSFVKSVDMRTAHASLSNFLFGRDFNIDNITEVRLCIEPYAAALAAEKMGESEKRELEKNLEESRQLIQREEAPRLRQLEMHFHEHIVASSANPIMQLVHTFAENLLMDVKAELTPDSAFAEDVLTAHEEICAAIVAGDAEAAADSMRRDILQVADALISLEEGKRKLNFI
ncbi:MAG: FCD domain-containing protein [Planctomycetaceae bacterium]|nr:FCD domain-containing protein [Planctomycetaceae bacterium]